MPTPSVFDELCQHTRDKDHDKRKTWSADMRLAGAGRRARGSAGRRASRFQRPSAWTRRLACALGARLCSCGPLCGEASRRSLTILRSSEVDPGSGADSSGPYPTWTSSARSGSDSRNQLQRQIQRKTIEAWSTCHSPLRQREGRCSFTAGCGNGRTRRIIPGAERSGLLKNQTLRVSHSWVKRAGKQS